MQQAWKTFHPALIQNLIIPSLRWGKVSTHLKFLAVLPIPLLCLCQACLPFLVLVRTLYHSRHLPLLRSQSNQHLMAHARTNIIFCFDDALILIPLLYILTQAPTVSILILACMNLSPIALRKTLNTASLLLLAS